MSFTRSLIAVFLLLASFSWTPGAASPTSLLAPDDNHEFSGRLPVHGPHNPSPTVVWPKIQLSALPGSLANPVHITHAGDNSGRLFVVELAGIIRVYQNGSLIPQPFLDIQGRVLSGGERGLLSVAFPPGYAGKGYFYVYYTKSSGDNVVSRFHLSQDPTKADPNSEETILLLSHPTYANHNGGQLVFGPDGYLYIGTGDGGGGGDPQGNAQSLGSLLGKILRIDVEPRNTPPILSANPIYLPLVAGRGTGLRYRIPPGNPYASTPGARPEIWFTGLRNPWRFSFDRQTGDLYIGDVGQGNYEEVDFQPASSSGGENYGWNLMEGLHCYGASSCSQTGLTLPILEYDHSLGCSITGGYVYRGPGYPGMQGFYFYADYCSGRIWAASKQGASWQSSPILPPSHSISSFGEDQAGNLYLADISEGTIYQVVESP